MKRVLVLWMVALLALAPALAKNSGSEEQAPTKLNEATVAELQMMMAAGTLTSVELTRYYIDRILALDESSTPTRLRLPSRWMTCDGEGRCSGRYMASR